MPLYVNHDAQSVMMEDANRFYGIVAATTSPNHAGQATTIAASGILNLYKCWIGRPVTVTSISYRVTTAGATLTSGQNLIGLYKSDGTLLRATADQSAAWTTAGNYTTALTASITFDPGAAGWIWVAILAKGTTVPIFLGQSAANSGPLSIGQTVSTAVSATNGSALTALPSPLVPTSNVFAANTVALTLT